MRAARAPFVCVMDADLQHPPEVLEEMYLEALGDRLRTWWSRAASARAATRAPFGRLRTALSRVSTRAAMLLFPTRLWHVSDPMSGCFLVRRDAVDLDSPAPARLQDPARDPRADARADACPRCRSGSASATPARPRRRCGRRCGTCGQLGRLELGQLSARFGRFTRRGRDRPGRQHAAAGAVRGRGGHLLRRGGDPRDPGLDAVELLPHRGLGVRGPRARAHAAGAARPCSSR